MSLHRHVMMLYQRYNSTHIHVLLSSTRLSCDLNQDFNALRMQNNAPTYYIPINDLTFAKKCTNKLNWGFLLLIVVIKDK